MSIRHTILAALNNEAMIMDGLVDATGLEKRKLSDNMQAAIKEGLVTRSKDDITGMPLYTITTAGRNRLEEGPAVHTKPRAEKTQKAEPVAEKQRDAWRELAAEFGCDTPSELRGLIQGLANPPEEAYRETPLAWVVCSEHSKPVRYINANEARDFAAVMAKADGSAMLCAVMGECEAVVKWKEAT